MMGFLFLALCFMVETAFLVITIVKKADVKPWILQRLYVSSGELVMYLLMLFLPGVDLGFRFIGFFIFLLLKTIHAGIVVLIRYRKASGKRSAVKSVIATVLCIVLFALSLVPSLLITDYQGLEVSGKYEVAETQAILIDTNRTETFETDGSFREVPIHFYYPANADGHEEYPLVLYSHGAFGYYQSNTSTYMELASNGYVVVSMDHPYHSFFTEDTKGKLITVNPEFIGDVYYVNEDVATEEEILSIFTEWLRIRKGDFNLVLDTLKETSESKALDDKWFVNETEINTILTVLSVINYDKIGLMGHSLGGATSVSVGRERNDIDAVIDLDGTMDGEVLSLDYTQMFEFEGKSYPTFICNDEPYPVPILSVDNEEHHDAMVIMGENYVNNVVMNNAVTGYNTYVVGSGHMNYTDLPLFSPILASKLGTGTVDELHCVEITNSLVLDFYNQYLKDGEPCNIQERYE